MEQKGKNSPSLIAGIVVLALLLAGAVGALFYNNKSMTRKVEELAVANEQLQLSNEQLQLSHEYEALNMEFAQYENQSQMLVNDSLVTKYAAAKSKVEKLIQELNSEKKKSAQRIKQLQDEVGTLKNILRHYVAQIDSLGKENAALRDENTQIKQQNQQLSTRVANETKRVEVLSERMTLAEKLNVTGVTLAPLNRKGKKEKNVTKAKQLMVTFTIPQNNSTPVGEKTIYLRIVNPEGSLLGNVGTFRFEGGSVGYTAKKNIEYSGEEVPGIRMYYDVTSTLTPGEYTVELFADNFRLTSRKFTLKK